MGGSAVLQFLQLAINGTAIGCIYALVALGFVLIYKATEVVNFAQGELMMLGAFFGYTFVSIWGAPYWLGMVGAVAATALFGALLERVVLRPMVGQPQFALVMLTIGVGFLARSAATMVPGWGTGTHAIATPFSDDAIVLAGAGDGRLVVSPIYLAVIVATLLLVALLALFFRFTRYGVAMQAVSQNQLAAYYMGIPVKTVFMGIWGLSAGVAAVAGLLLAPITLVEASMGFIGLKAFPAAVLGGFGSLPGAVAGGLIIGIIEALAGFYLPAGFKDVAAYIVLLLVLLLMPQGLFGRVARKKV